MELATKLVAVLASVALGLSAGALVAEGAVLVPFWRSLQPAAFLAWYREYADLLLKVFGSLEIAGAGLALAALALSWLQRVAAPRFRVIAALLAVAVLAAFPLYFQAVNASFAAGTITPDQVSDQLQRWARWHWARTALAAGAFVASIIAAEKSQP